MDNAIQFTPVGGSVTLCARTKNDRLIIEVIDTGTGISSDFLPHIFERFFKGDSARMYRSGGAGLGLPMAKRIIELHGGQIEVESIPDVSTTFRIVLPMV